MDETKESQTSHLRPAPAPSRQLREHAFHTLPAYSGPYSVGCMEIELPVREPRIFSRIKRDNIPALRLDTVLFSIYYPCDVSSYASNGKTPSKPTWLPRPRARTCKGYAKFLSIPRLPVTAYIAGTTMFTKLPALRNAKLAGGPPHEQNPPLQEDSQATLGGDSGQNPVFPVILFSHGLGGSRMCCSAVCGEMASNGFVVVALEHRDGSGARSYVNVPPSQNLADCRVLDNTKSENSYLVDYIFPKDNPLDTSPNNERGPDTELRTAQIEMRLAEIEEAYAVLELINKGQGELVLKNNLRKEGNIGSSSKGLDNIDWSDWLGRLHLNQVTVMGHSFGGATTVQMTREGGRFPWVGQGIALDAWGPAIPKLGDSCQKPTTKPLLAIGSEAFMHWPENFDGIAELCKNAADAGGKCWMMTIKGSTHLSQTDFAILYPNWMSWFAKTMIHPRRAVAITINSSLEFLKMVLPEEQTVGNSWIDEHFLDTEVFSPENGILDEYRPDEKWMAARLKIPHEFRLRLMNWLRRVSEPPDAPRDASGKPLVGLITRRLGDEVWMHLSPRKGNVEDGIEPSEELSRRESSTGSKT
ncbi:hypothetical protein JX265_005984 [Neoarthrinium moseri]|uniref:1-alkyl-2-acetylglycerophosphocholine esterase n=1 Tax=Neoarthrinium moseri TaxID=1658444 RepID=A0A9Q0APU6_9PEZI|nr:uncharacterized protein JN550_004198 [Neoarthrinium moseri]KAI1855581.1 hypothetical protein JX266_000446 [Neoarthrinium moseri]KAI1870944.1 hypothetical protein JX265_005984 [Neoarthrinium moseri]KAI1871995.1 hypothetical protein JN550_004198 [Neoarthrinium moseri]